MVAVLTTYTSHKTIVPDANHAVIVVDRLFVVEDETRLNTAKLNTM